jgi:pimeloyl-ACP methyl ester carboxylesterase
MFDGFEEFSIATKSDPDISLFGRRGGTSAPGTPPVLLLHGFPQSHHMWHRVAPQLIDRYEVIMLDIRGYGQSSKPERLEGYAKSAMARDCVEVMEKLGCASFYLCGHDRGARIAHKVCVDYPERIKKLILLDICPTLAMYESTDLIFAQAYFHWFFLSQPAPFPEDLILGNPRVAAQRFLVGLPSKVSNVFDPECFEYYVGCIADPDTIHTMCQDYRASASLDLEEQRQDLQNGRLIRCPVTVLWGRHGLIEKKYNPLEEWRKVTQPGVAVSGRAVDSGHFIPEELPNEVVLTILDFFKE